MLDLLAVSYWNIGPFREQKKTLFFHKGKYLIKAPIGSGKSFLFFDGPSYALYKTAGRNLLNIQSKVGTIKLLFAYNEQVFLIKRVLKKGKVKDSCASELFELTLAPEELEAKWADISVLQDGVDIEEFLSEKGIGMEAKNFKNESDLQAHLNDFLPPQEVFTSTVILLQDAENIFELQPAQRLEVLKNVFNLMSIDESKEIIKERRNELKYQIKAYEDTSLTQEKLRTGLLSLIQSRREIRSSSLLEKECGGVEEVIEELENYVDKLGIAQFELDDKLGMILPDMIQKIKEQQEAFQAKRNLISAFMSQKSDLDKQIVGLESQVLMKEARVKQLQQSLLKANPERVKQLRGEKLELQHQQQALETQAFSVEIEGFWSLWQEKLGLEERASFGLLENHRSVLELLDLGKKLKGENELLTGNMENLKAKSQTEQNALVQQIKALGERQAFYVQQQELIEKQIVTFDMATEERAAYQCERIGEYCPFIRAIDKHYFEQREQEKSKMLIEKQDLLSKIQTEHLDEKLSSLKQELEKLVSGALLEEQMQSLIGQQKKNEGKIQILKTFLLSIDYKKLEELVKEYKTLALKISEVEKLLLKEEDILQQMQHFQQEKAQLEGELSSLGQQLIQFKEQKKTLEEQISEVQRTLQLALQSEWEKVSLSVQRYQRTWLELSALIEDYKNLQLKIKALSQQNKILDNLYTILNKELLLFVLSEYLPILSEIINSYLVVVVDYQISIRLMETSEKLELETKILDDKGERDIKSLSGGQRAILKLVWMLAISSYMHTKLLFLDETINNLDNDTVGRVADLLTNFVKQREMKFYTITHNSEIQSMNIWDEIIALHSGDN